jgi:hypothetical protein
MWKTTHPHLRLTFAVHGTFTYKPTTAGETSNGPNSNSGIEPCISFINLSNGSCGKAAVPKKIIYRGSSSDSFGAGNLSNSKQICLGGL